MVGEGGWRRRPAAVAVSHLGPTRPNSPLCLPHVQGAHQRYFRQQVRGCQRVWNEMKGCLPACSWQPLAPARRAQVMAGKVPELVCVAKQALADGHCAIIGLQSTGEAVTNQMVRIVHADIMFCRGQGAEGKEWTLRRPVLLIPALLTPLACLLAERAQQQRV